MRTTRPTPTPTATPARLRDATRRQPQGDASIERLATIFRLASVLLLAATLVALTRG